MIKKQKTSQSINDAALIPDTQPESLSEASPDSALPWSESKIPSFGSLPTFKLETLSSISSKHGELRFQRLFGLRLIECRILGVVAFYSPITLRQLCIEIGLEKSQGSRFVARLVEIGLLDRYYDPEDQRSFYLLLTESGRKLRNQINIRAVERNHKLLDCLTKEQSTVFMECLDLLTTRARTMLAEETLEDGHELPPQPTHESTQALREPPGNEKKPVPVDPVKLRSLHQQLG